MTVATERGGCGGVGSQRTIPPSAQMIVVLQTLAPEGKKKHTYCHPSSSKRGQCFSAKSNVTPTQSDSPTALRDTMGRIPYSGFTGNWSLCSALCFKILCGAGWCAKINKDNERMCDNRILTWCTYAFPIVTVVVFWCWNAARFVRRARWKSGQEVDKKDDTSDVHGNTALLIYSYSKLWAEALYLHILRRVGEGWKVMKVGFHVYLMPWFAELHSDVNGNEGWHVENRLCHLSPPQV